MRVWLMAACLAALPMMAAADEIGGDWCSVQGAHLRIEGSRVQSFGGTWTEGNYSRHAYDFVVPEGEADAGLIVKMRLLSEQDVLVAVEGRDTEQWSRCEIVS